MVVVHTDLWITRVVFFFFSAEQVLRIHEKHLSPEQFVQKCEHLYDNFFSDKATLQLNIDASLQKAWKKAILETKNAEEVNKVLEATNSAVKINMLDTFNRFKHIAFYEKWQRTSMARTKTMHNLGWVPEERK